MSFEFQAEVPRVVDAALGLWELFLKGLVVDSPKISSQQVLGLIHVLRRTVREALVEVFLPFRQSPPFRHLQFPLLPGDTAEHLLERYRSLSQGRETAP